ncbi:hypothetical protein ACP70R_047346 [Stipagrostis hirtigluma subsp. patula]
MRIRLGFSSAVSELHWSWRIPTRIQQCKFGLPNAPTSINLTPCTAADRSIHSSPRLPLPTLARSFAALLLSAFSLDRFMAISVARVHLAVAHASLPGLLPTPPMISPLLPASMCLVFLPAKPKPSRADADERWDAHKKPASQGSSAIQSSWDGKSVASCSSAGDSSSSRSSRGRSSRADANERWDAHKKPVIAAAAAASSVSSCSRASSGDKCGSSTPAIRRAARWDAHKKPCPSQADDGESSIGSNDDDGMELDKQPLYAGSGFIASPEPSILPKPTMFLVRARA